MTKTNELLVELGKDKTDLVLEKLDIIIETQEAQQTLLEDTFEKLSDMTDRHDYSYD